MGLTPKSAYDSLKRSNVRVQNTKRLRWRRDREGVVEPVARPFPAGTADVAPASARGTSCLGDSGGLVHGSLPASGELCDGTRPFPGECRVPVTGPDPPSQGSQLLPSQARRPPSALNRTSGKFLFTSALTTLGFLKSSSQNLGGLQMFLVLTPSSSIRSGENSLITAASQ